MQLEGVTAELRPRSDWEAVDLGIALVRRDFRRVFGYWWLAMVPGLILGAALLPSVNAFWMLAMVWWWTPVCSRMVLFYLSRHLFGERPGWRAMLRELPRAVSRRFFFRMVLARFSPWRPLTMAVEDLEGLRGSAYSQRVKLLLRRGDATVVTVALWRAVLLGSLAMVFFRTMVLFLPTGEADRWQEFIDSWQAAGWLDPAPVVKVMVLASALMAMCLTDLFATGIGFGVYINHRTWIEGWDVEIAFRRLGNRLARLVPVLLAGALLMAGGLAQAAPLPDPDEVELSVDPAAGQGSSAGEQTPADVVKKIKQQPEFEVHKQTIREPKTPPSRSTGPPGGLAMFLTALGTGVFWLVIGAAIAGLIFLCWQFRHVFRGSGGGAAKTPVPTTARVVMGMNVTPESLPKDIPAMALELWQAGRLHEALSLLYRGSISRLIAVAQVEIAESDTESDCLGRVSEASPGHASWFGTLTKVWMRLAYARLEPADAEIRQICATWPFALERGKR